MRIWMILGLLVLGGCDLVLRPDLDPCSSSNPSTAAVDWNGYHWPEDSRTVHVVDKTAGAYDVSPHLAAWNALGAPVQFSSAVGWEVVVEVGGDDDSSYLGLAQVKLGPNGHIRAGKVIMNRTALASAGLGNAAADHVLCQELGHLLGLGHERDMMDTCMNDAVGARSRAEWKAILESEEGRTPNADDGRLLREKYPLEGDVHDGPPGLACQGRLIVHKMPTYGGDNGHVH